MSKRKHEATTSEDSSLLPQRGREELDSYYRTPTIKDLLQYHNGSKQETIEALAGTTDKKSKAYNNARRDVNRWLDGTRKPRKDTREKFDSIVANDKYNFIEPPDSVNVTISGTIGYDDNIRHRTLNFNVDGATLAEILRTSQDNPSAAYGNLMAAYFNQPAGTPTPITVYGGNDLSIQFS